MFPRCRLTMTSHQLIGNTPCPASTHRPAHLGSSGQQGPSWVTHSRQPWPRRPGSFVQMCISMPWKKGITGCMASASPAKAPASPPAPKRKDTEAENFIYQLTCAEKSHILPGGGAGTKTAWDESLKSSIWVMEIVWRAFHWWAYCSEAGPYQA